MSDAVYCLLAGVALCPRKEDMAHKSCVLNEASRPNETASGVFRCSS